jgi:hypothetical protein
MPLRGRTTFAMVVTWAATACASATEPSAPRATVTVQRDTIVASRVVGGSVTWIRFTVPAAIHNGGSVSLTYPYCVSVIEAPARGVWGVVWSPICALGSKTDLEIAPGETRQISVDVSAAVAGPGGPTWGSASVDGTYRLAVGLVAAGLDGRIPQIPSNPFTLVDGSR